MDNVLRNLADHTATVLLVLIVGVLGQLLAVYILGRKIATDHGKWRRLLEGARGETLEKLLYDHLRQHMTTQERLESLDRQVEELQRQGLNSKQYVGVEFISPETNFWHMQFPIPGSKPLRRVVPTKASA